MTELVRRLYESALANGDFVKEAYEADGDTKPNWFSSKERKVFYATIYYGWLVGKYKNDWRRYI